MSKRINFNILDFNKINNYNKLLITLDHKNNTISDTNTTNLENYNNELDIIIKKINEKFEKYNFISKHFSGLKTQNVNDIHFNNPNNYIELNNISNKKSDIDKTNEIKNVNINVEIKEISDILSLIDQYKLEPDIKYNINMKALHNIKEPLEKLNNMIGMKELKNNIVDQILYFIQDMHKNNNDSGDYLHTVLYGPPGTGKTEIAKIMGQIYSKIGILQKGIFKKVTRSDLIAGYLGQTALKTREVIKESLGGVLFIDEAYSLGNSEKRDSFSKECIDTLCEALSDNRDNLMVIIAGYEDELKECFFNYNQGLDSRFTWRFKTDDYTADDLYKIFVKKVKDIGWTIQIDSNINADWFKKNKKYFSFYGRDIETTLAKTKISHGRRVFCKSEDEKKKITLEDLENGFKMFINNNNIKDRVDKDYFKNQLINTMYC